MKILLAECIPKEDPVGQLSRIGWAHATKDLAAQPNISIDHLDVESPEDLAGALKREQYHMLILSAHGVYDQDHNVAGISCGKTATLGLEFGRVPPLVIVSSCHVAPRGVGAVNIADLFIRQGAMAVLGTLVPINVRWNAILMTRFLVYVHQAISGAEPMASVEDIWHHTVATNAVHDILSANHEIHAWSHARINGVSPVEDFKLKRSRGRLTRGNIYRDSVAILRDISVEHGIEKRFDAWMVGGFVPESLFYAFIGDPGRLLVKPLTE